MLKWFPLQNFNLVIDSLHHSLPAYPIKYREDVQKIISFHIFKRCGTNLNCENCCNDQPS